MIKHAIILSFIFSANVAFGETITFDNIVVNEVSAVPLPAATWLFGSAMLGLVGLARRKKA